MTKRYIPDKDDPPVWVLVVVFVAGYLVGVAAVYNTCLQ